MKKILSLIFICLTIGQISGQINVKVGYGLNFLNAEVNDAVLQEFNSIKRSELSDSLSIPFSNLNSMHGINVGIRFRTDNYSAFEITLENLSRRKEAVGEINNTSLFSQELFYSFNQVYISYQRILNQFGFGLGFGINKVGIKDKIAGSDFKKSIMSETQTLIRTNLAYYFKGSGSVSFSIQPFLQLSLKDIDLNPLRDELNLASSPNAGEAFTSFGISFIFYNGRQ